MKTVENTVFITVPHFHHSNLNEHDFNTFWCITMQLKYFLVLYNTLAVKLLFLLD